MAGRISKTFALVVRFELLERQEAAFDGLVAETLDGIRAHEPGTLAYIVHQEPAAPRARVFYELYRDVEAFEEHERQPHVRHFLAERSKHLVSRVADSVDKWTRGHFAAVMAERRSQ